MTDTTLQDLLGSPGEKSIISEKARPRRRWTRLLPGLLLMGFVALAWILFGDTFLPAREVQLEQVVTLRQLESAGREAETSSEVGLTTAPEVQRDPWEAQMLFQASGWIEPDPLPIKATALVNGVVETVFVLEGESVKKGDLLASLIREDFELDLATAESLASAARARLDTQAAAIAAVEAKTETLMKQVEAGRLRCLELIDRRDRLKRAGGGAVAEGEIIQATLALQTHEAQVDALEISREELMREREQLLAEKEELTAKVREAETEVARRRLALDRTEIRSPVDGIILHLHAVPGQKRMLNMDDPNSSTIADLFQPGFLQARIDVPLEEANQISEGQAVRLRSGFLPGEIIRGVVTRIAGEADIQRNTLQAKVRLENPDHRLRPDMLCRAEFLAGTEMADAADGEEQTQQQAGSRVAVFVPEVALVEPANGEASVWTPGPRQETLTRRAIEIGSPVRDGFVPVISGLRPGEMVVISPPRDLREGERYREMRNNETS